MAEFNFFRVFAQFGADTALVAFIVVLCAWVLEKTLLKNRLNEPVVWFLPFLLGVVFSCILQIILYPDFAYFVQNVGDILRRGAVAGCLAAPVSAIFAPFCGKEPLSARAAIVRELIDGVASEKADELAQKIADSVSLEYSDEDVQKVFDLLSQFVEEGEKKAELFTLATLVVQTLKTTAT